MVALNTGCLVGLTRVGSCDGRRTGESFTFFLFSLYSVEAGNVFLVFVAFDCLTGFLELGLGCGAASSSSLEGTSNTLALTGESDEGVLEVCLLAMLSASSASLGAMLGDLDSKNWVSAISGASGLGAGDEKP